MRAMSAAGFNGYEDLKLIDLPKPQVSEGKVLVRMTAAGATPLTTLSCLANISQFSLSPAGRGRGLG